MGKKIVDMSSQIKTLYEQNVEEDNFLYLRIKTEDTYWIEPHVIYFVLKCLALSALNIFKLLFLFQYS